MADILRVLLSPNRVFRKFSSCLWRFLLSPQRAWITLTIHPKEPFCFMHGICIFTIVFNKLVLPFDYIIQQLFFFTFLPSPRPDGFRSLGSSLILAFWKTKTVRLWWPHWTPSIYGGVHCHSLVYLRRKAIEISICN